MALRVSLRDPCMMSWSMIDTFHARQGERGVLVHYALGVLL